MNPPTEQLIRDYLNRLSLAARGKLGDGDRQSLLDRTRAQIEAECGGTSEASAAAVRRALAGLGDPVALVELEHAKVKAGSADQEGGGATAMQAEPDGVFDGSEPEDPPGGPDTGKDIGTGGAIPAPRVAPESAATPSEAEPRSGSGSAAPPQRSPAEQARLDRRARLEREVALTTSASAGALARIAAFVLDLVRSHTVEFLAVLLLGVGGVIYPPIWLIGAIIALPSKKWDIRDKFIGITMPVVLVIIGTVLVLVLGGQHGTIEAYAQEAWFGAERLSRVLVLLGAGYLLWGLRRGRRTPKQPPWNVPHKLG